MNKSYLLSAALFSLTLGCSLSGPQSNKTSVLEDSPELAQYVSDGDCSDHHSHEHEPTRLPSSQAACADITPQEMDEVEEIIAWLGGDVRDPKDYEFSTQGLQQFMDDSGVISRFSATEMVRPNNVLAAKRCGHEVLLPSQCRWKSGAAQALLAGKLRGVINDGQKHGPRGISLRNWWRPACYNKAVGGAGASDHIQARGFDLDFATPQERAQAQAWLCQAYKDRPFNLQVGIGCQTLHIGMGSPKRLSQYPQDGSRFWTYGSLQNCPIKRLPEDDCWSASRSTGKRFIWTDQRKNIGGAL